MAEYINIKGQNIEVVASDPANPTLGQIWYNSTSNTLKGLVYAPAAFSTGGTPVNSKTAGGISTNGTQSAVTWAGGGPGGPNDQSTEQYDGTSWSVHPATIPYSVFSCGSAGTQTATLIMGGGPTPAGITMNQTAEFDGSSWTTSGNLNVGRRNVGGTGTQTAAVALGGGNPPVTAVENYNGTTWTNSGAYPTALYGIAGLGTQTAALALGGDPPISNKSNEYNGSTWSSEATMSNTRSFGGSFGTQNDGITTGGEPTGITTEGYNGTSWTTLSNNTSPYTNAYGTGDSTAGLIVNGPQSSEWNAAGPATKTITSS